MTEPTSRAVADEPRSPWLRGGFVLAAAFVGFVAVIGAAVALGPTGSGTSDSTPQTSSTHTDGPPRPASTGSAASCPALADTGQDVPSTTPGGVTWALYRAVALPSSDAAGPAVTNGDVARCYAHTPVGALLATTQISVRYLAAEDWASVTRTQTVGVGRDAYIAERTKAEQTASPDREDSAHGQIAGFRFVTYSETTAVLQTVWRFPDGRMQAATTTVLWQRGDWKLEYPAAPAAPVPVDSLAGYIEWGGL
ncbi:hypothetical protein [Streptomyces sp. CoH17]|uniref:hypothetical protein n=1 Tax=Streptomyces sp. CoH17 TaxID=2992806 RepID=UPI00226DF6CE|nr:hypothetical protein [Streptomyces sp. CoH17]